VVAANVVERAHLAWYYGASTDRIAVIPCGVDTELFRPMPQVEAKRLLALPPDPLLLYVGRLQPIKGLETLLEAMTALDGAARLLIVGGDQDEPENGHADYLRERVASLGLAERVDLDMGTFSKAFGVYGAYVAGSRAWIDHLVSTCRTLIYSTALPPPVVSAIDASLDLVRDAGELRRALQEKSERFRGGLRKLGFDTGRSATQIVPAVVGSNERALAFAAALEELGVLAVAIRPPTVLPGTARVRFSLMATHSDEELGCALAAIEEAARRTSVIPAA